MHRIPVAQRPNLKETALEHGYEYRAGVGVPYWDETAYYRFTLREIEEDLEKPAEEIEAMCFQLLDHSLANETVYRRLHIPETYWDYVADSWRNREKDLYGRLDFSYDGAGAAKLLEYNADTPTTLYESAIFQWVWLEEAIAAGLIPRDCDQFTELHEDLVDSFRAMGTEGLLHLACLSDIEDDRETVKYLDECAREAGLETQFLAMKDIGIDARERFTDLDDHVITTLFKLYPWEWIMAEEFGRNVPASGVQFIEPPWKAILANKGLLPLLWGMFEGHPNLLPAFFEDDSASATLADAGSYVRKPLLSRQGANIEIVDDGKTIFHSDGPYGEDAQILQAFHPLPDFGGKYPLVGCWLVASKAVGLGIREDTSLVTGTDSRFVPHVILD